MPNARDAHATSKHKFLLLGDTGSGKTTQLITLPGKKFAYLFDAGAILSLRGYDIDYEEYLPDRLNLATGSLSKGKGDTGIVKSSDLYQRWEQSFNDKLESGFFDTYDVLAMDSCTTFLDIIMDRVLSINGRFGQAPQQDDYSPQMVTFVNVCRNWVSLDKTVLITGHLDEKQDRLTQRIMRKPMMTGRLTTKIPLLFSDIFVTEADSNDEGKKSYTIRTIPDKMTTCVRTSIRGLGPYEDVTIDLDKNPVGQGLGGILNWEAKQNTTL